MQYRNLIVLICCQLISATGDWLGLLATIAVAARLSEGSEGAAIALVLASRVAPGFFLATAAEYRARKLARHAARETDDALAVGL